MHWRMHTICKPDATAPRRTWPKLGWLTLTLIHVTTAVELHGNCIARVPIYFHLYMMSGLSLCIRIVCDIEIQPYGIVWISKRFHVKQVKWIYNIETIVGAPLCVCVRARAHWNCLFPRPILYSLHTPHQYSWYNFAFIIGMQECIVRWNSRTCVFRMNVSGSERGLICVLRPKKIIFRACIDFIHHQQPPLLGREVLFNLILRRLIRSPK